MKSKKRFKWRRVSKSRLCFLLLSVPLLVSCRGSRVPAERYLHDLPGREELIGRWAIDEPSLQRIRSAGLYRFSKTAPSDYLIAIERDGTCSFKSYRAFQSDGDYLESTGKWQVTKIESPDSNRSQVAAVCFTLTTNGHVDTKSCFWLRRELGGIAFWTFIGDPDSRQFADFRKLP
jgi:hypothetical protein